MKKGDKIITRGGIVAKIIEIQGKDDDFLLIDCEGNSNFALPLIWKISHSNPFNVTGWIK